MPSRKTLGGNLGQTGGMMAALGFKQPAAPDAGEAAEVRRPSPPPAPMPPAARLDPRPLASPAASAAEAEEAAVEPPAAAVSRIATDLSTARLDLAKRAAYWNRETLRSFLERAIEAEAGRIAREQGLASLPAAPSPRRGRPLRP